MKRQITLNCAKPVPELKIEHVDVSKALEALVVLELALKEKLNLTSVELDDLKLTSLITIAQKIS